MYNQFNTMATQEKLQKSLDSLKSLSKPQQTLDGTKKKEKIQHCYVITEAISNPTIRISTNFSNLLGSSIEVFLKLCEDQEADVRMTSEECLNRIIRASTDSHIRRIQIELHKEIKQNGPARSLRAALWLFSVLAHHIKPHKGKPYVVNLFPSIIKITERNEESVHETLAASLPNIMKTLGCFTSENEIKVLLKAFLTNIGSESAVIRRTKIASIVTICLNCRNPHLFVVYCLNFLMELLIPVNGSESSSLILGVLSGIKALIPNLKVDQLKEGENEKLLQVFELCLHYLSHKDHNIVNVSLEVLNTLIQSCNEFVKVKLLTRIGHSKIFSPLPQGRSPSQLSVSTNTTTGDENIFSESELTETIHSDIEKWIDESKLSVMNVNFARTKDKSISLEKIINFPLNTIKNSGDVYDYNGKMNELSKNFISKLKTHSFGDNLDVITTKSENSSEKSVSDGSEDRINNDGCDNQDIDIGDLTSTKPILYCIRLITKSFLLNAKTIQEQDTTYIPDKLVRVSVKHLALTCLSTIFHRIYPKGLFAYLDRSFDDDDDNHENDTDNSKKNAGGCRRKISDLLVFRGHSDPQLRGAVRSLLANFIKSVSTRTLDEGRVVVGELGGYEEWLKGNAGDWRDIDRFSCENIVKIFVEGIEDESSTCIRQSLISLRMCLKYLIESEKSVYCKPLLNVLPAVAHNPYWLVKVSLCELVSNIDYITINYMMDSNELQQKVIYNILFELLGDSDQRVRTSAANAFVDIMSKLYFEEYEVKKSPAICKATSDSYQLFESLKDYDNNYGESNVNKQHFIEQMPFPFSEISKIVDDKIDFALSKILIKLFTTLMTTTSKQLINGCVEALSLLSNAYPCTVYKNAWTTNDFENVEMAKTKIPDLLKHCISLLTDSVQVYDIAAHINILKLASNLYAGNALSLTKHQVEDSENPTKLWNMFDNQNFSDLSEQFLGHIIKLLNIFHHVLNEVVPIAPSSQAQTKPVLSAATTAAAATLSPLKRRKSDLDKKTMIAIRSDEKNDRKDGVKMANMSVFSNSSHYLKIFEVLKCAFINYKISLDSDSSQIFLDLLQTTLQCISVMMEIGSLLEFSRISEDILLYFRSTFNIEAPGTVLGVQQLLKCLIGTNLTANILEFNEKQTEVTEEFEVGGFYYNLFQKPYTQMSQHIAALARTSSSSSAHHQQCDIDNETVMGYLHRKDARRRRSMVLNRSSDKVLASYIRLFEPMVIKSLEQYTITSNVRLQCKVLQLLSQLVQLRVNYCLLDSEQVFIGFVLKQFEFIEEGQIPLVQELIPRIFQFLVQLSYSKQHSKCIISVPKIIQLCDGLMASGQPSTTHCIPALEPIVEDIFLTRNKSNTSDMKELETTREVILSMLLRLCENQQVIDLITVILDDSRYCTDNIEKWLDWSKRVFTVVLPMLDQKKLKINDSHMLITLRRFMMALNPEVFKPFDEIILMFFEPPPTLDSKLFNYWLSKISILLTIITTLKEETLLAKINRLKSNFSPESIFKTVTTKADPLNVNNNSDTFEKIPAEIIFIRFILRVISVTTKQCLKYIHLDSENTFTVEQLGIFLVNCLYIFQAGNHCKITNMATTILKKNIPFDKDDINFEEIIDNFMNLGRFYPVLTFQWNTLLALVNYDNKYLLSKVLTIEEGACERLKSPSLPMEIIKIGAAISACDYMSENMTESNLIQCFIKNNSKLLTTLCNEPPVNEFISALHRNCEYSKIFIANLRHQLSNKDSLIQRVNIIKSIENCHSSQISSVLQLLIPDMLNCRQAAVSRMAANLACRKIELLLTLNEQEVTNQLSKENVEHLQKALLKKNMFKRYESLVSLLNKLSAQYFDLSPIEFEQRRTVHPDDVQKLKINKKWYLSQIQVRYDDITIGRETAELLSHLEYNEIISFMSSSDFNKLSSKYCFKHGLAQLERSNSVKNNDIIQASVDCLMKDVTSIVNRIPQPHQVFKIQHRQPSNLETTYNESCTQLFENEDYSNLLISIAECIPYFVKCITRCSSDLEQKISGNNMEDLMKFAVICMEYINFLTDIDDKVLQVHSIDVLLAATDCTLKLAQACKLLGSEGNLSWFCSSVHCLFKLVNVLLKRGKPLPCIPQYALSETIKNTETMIAGEATHQLYILTCWLHQLKSVNVLETTTVPDFLFVTIKSVIVGLSRLPIVNSYIMIPSTAWKHNHHGFVNRDDGSSALMRLMGTFRTEVPQIPIDLLQDIEVLEEYIFRILLLGWITRQQFEETWMCLLSVLCHPLDDLDPLELNDVLHASNLAIKSITSLLLETLCSTDPGNPNIFRMIHVPRDEPINDESTCIKKLKNIQDNIEHSYYINNCTSATVNKTTEMLNVFRTRNFEKFSHKYNYGQVSIKYCLLITGIIKDTEDSSSVAEISRNRRNMLVANGLDLNSCLQFLIDYYTQLMKPQASTHIRILHEVIRSTVIISDLFMDRSQFQWMLDVFLELSKLHTVEDELLHQYLIIGVCKAVAVLSPEMDIYEQVKKLLIQYLKSPYLSSRIASLYGLLYILEGCKLTNITIGGISEEMQLFIPCAVEYIQCNLNVNNVLKKSQEHSCLLWSLAFYLIENIDESNIDANFVTTTTMSAFNVVSEKSTALLNQAIMKHLERLLIIKKGNMLEKFGKQYLKLAMEKMRQDNPILALSGIQLLLTYMYIDCKDHLQSLQNATTKNSQTDTNTEHLVQTIEKISAIFERVKKGYVYEVEIICSTLPLILDDLFTPSDILTKVIGEFLSPQQPHPKFLSRVVFQVFESAIAKDQLPLLQDWVVFSLSNFTQSCSIGMATWCLTCFFISATTNTWLRSYFPYVQSRVGRYEYADKKIFCIAGANFYRNLTSDKQRQTFVDSFTKVKDQVDTPFSDLLLSL